MDPEARAERNRLGWAKENPFIVLISVQLVLLVADVTVERGGAYTPLTAFLMVLFIGSSITALVSVHMPVRHLKLLGGLAVLLRLFEYFVHLRGIGILIDLIWGAFSLMLVVSLLQYALSTGKLSTNSKLASVASAYIAFPQFWVAVFLIIQALNPHAFNPGGNQTGPLDYQDMLLFSYNVFTTVAITNVTPTSHLAAVTVVIAEIVAQLFVVIFIARLVGVFPQEDHHHDKK